MRLKFSDEHSTGYLQFAQENERRTDDQCVRILFVDETHTCRGVRGQKRIARPEDTAHRIRNGSMTVK